MSWKEKASIEKEKLKQMSARDKIWYIWEYYKFHLAALAVVICLISVIGNALYRQSFTTRLSIAVINDRSGDTSSMDPLEADLRQVLDCGKKDIIEINTGGLKRAAPGRLIRRAGRRSVQRRRFRRSDDPRRRLPGGHPLL